jgi:kynurenine formamidase
VVIFHSGWNQLLGVDDERWLAAHPGLGEDGAEFLAAKGVVAVGADTPALEVIPFELFYIESLCRPILGPQSSSAVIVFADP